MLLTQLIYTGNCYCCRNATALVVAEMKSARAGLLRFLVISLVLLCSATSAVSWSMSIFSSSSSSRSSSKGAGGTPLQLDGGATAAGFSIDGARNDPRGARLMDNARRRIDAAACWSQAYTRLFASCADIMADKERQSRLAWHLSSCFQEDSGRPPLPACDDRSAMLHCRKRLSDYEDKVFLEFFLEANTLCHQLQYVLGVFHFVLLTYSESACQL